MASVSITQPVDVVPSLSKVPLAAIEEESAEKEIENIKPNKKGNKQSGLFARLFAGGRDKNRDSKSIEDSEASTDSNEAAGAKYNAEEMAYITNQELEKKALNFYKLGKAIGYANPKAISFFQGSLEARTTLYGHDSPQVADVLECIGTINKCIGNDNEALSYYEKALKIFRIVETKEAYKNNEERAQMLDIRKRVVEMYVEVLAQKSEKKDDEQNFSSVSANNPTEVAAQVEVYREVERLGDYEGETGSLDKAVIFYNNAISLMKKIIAPDHEYVLGTQVKLADAYIRNGEVMKAIDLHTSISDYLMNLRERNIYFLKVLIYNVLGYVKDDTFSSIYKIEKMGDKFLESGTETTNCEQANIFYKRALNMLLDTKGIEPGSKHILRVHIKLGTVHWMSDPSNNMLEAYKNLIAYFEEKGNELYEKKDLQNASLCYTQVLRSLMIIVDPKHEAVQKVLLKISDMHMDIHKHEQALNLYKYYKSSMVESDASTNTLIEKKIATALEYVGNTFLKSGEGESALNHYRESLNILRTNVWESDEKHYDAAVEAQLLHKIGESYFIFKNYVASELSYLESLKIRSHNSINNSTPAPNEVEYIADTNFGLGCTYYFMNKYAEAEKCLNKAITTRVKIYDASHKKIFSAKLAMCFVHEKYGSKDKAFREYNELLEDFDGHTPHGHPITNENFVAWKQLAKLKAEDGKAGESFRILAKQLHKLKYWPGADPLLIFDTLREMGEMLVSLGKYKSAIKYFEMAIRERERITNKDDLNDNVFLSLGYCYGSLRDVDMALECYSKCLNVDESAIENQLVYNNIGNQLAKLGKYEEALQFLHTAVLYLRETDDDDNVVMTLNNIGNVYCRMDDILKATEYYSSALELSESKNIEPPPYTKYNLGNICLQKGEIAKAKLYFEAFLCDIEKFTSKESYHSEYKSMKSNGLNNVASILCSEGKYEDAVGRFSEALILKTEYFGADSVEIFGTLCNLGSTCHKLRNYDHAEKYYSKALDLTEKIETDSDKVAQVLCALGSINLAKKDYDKALDFFKLGFTLQNQVLKGDDRKQLLSIRYKMGIVLYRMRSLRKALELFKSLHISTKKIYGREDAETIKVILSLAQVHLDLHHEKIAKDLCMRAIIILRRRKYPASHPFVKRTNKILGKAVSKFLEV